MSAASPSDDLSPPSAVTAQVPAPLAPHQSPAAQAAAAVTLSRIGFGLVAAVALVSLLLARRRRILNAPGPAAEVNNPVST